ncbi:MAG: hypothetical protein CMH54_04310, partial [Myxococcales bacterium]|nr:hypothetical protein [Myxococcales bacterium]
MRIRFTIIMAICGLVLGGFTACGNGDGGGGGTDVATDEGGSDEGGSDEGGSDEGGSDEGSDAEPTPTDQCLNEADGAIIAAEGTCDIAEGEDTGSCSNLATRADGSAYDCAEDGDCTLSGLAQSLGVACVLGGAADVGACAGPDYLALSGLSLGCGTCYLGATACGAEFCTAECLGPDGDACSTCVADNCSPAFFECTGLTPTASLCDTYCGLAEANCTDDNAIDFGDDDCATACAAYSTDGGDGDAGGDTVQCRIYHLGVAADDPATHCPHGNVEGGGVCVDAEPTLCDTYCDLASNNCTDDNAIDFGDDDCATACAAYSADGTDGDAGGDTVQCRIYHLGVAADDPAT